MITTKSYKSQIKRGTKLLFSYQLIYINDRQLSGLLRYTQTTTHTVPPNAAPHTIQRIASNNIQQQNTRRSIASHPISYRIPTLSRFDCYYNTSDQTLTDPRNKINISRETKTMDENQREQATPQPPAYVCREQASQQPNSRHTVVFTL